MGRKKNSRVKLILFSTDCSVSDQWSARIQKLHVLTSAARFHKGHQHPPTLPPHQHPTGAPHLQGPERPYCHTQGETLNVQPYKKVPCWQTLVSHLGKPNLQLSASLPGSFLLTQTLAYSSAHTFSLVEA